MARNSPPPKKPKSAIDKDAIRDLASLLDETGLTEIEVEQEGLRVRVARQAAVMSAPTPSAYGAPAPAPVPLPAPAVDFGKHAGVVTSPMVGTAYLAPSPGAKPFVEIGSHVRAGDTLLVIEAMKTMNQIPSPQAGTVIQILIEDGHPVEFGEAMMIIE